MSFDQWNSYSAWILDSLARASLHGGIAAAIVWTLCTLVPRLPANAKSWLWRLVFVKILLALIWGRPIELPILAPSHVDPITLSLSSVGTMPDASEKTAFTVEPTPNLTLPPNSGHEAEVIVPTKAAIAESPASVLNGKSILLLAWLGGVSVGFFLLARQYFQAGKLRRSIAICTTEHLVPQLIALSRAVGLVRLPRLCTSSSATRPMLIGILRPTVIFPEKLLATASPESLRMMIAHELAHVRRADLAWTALAAVVRAIFFFHPLVWLARRESLLAQEVACDELALQITSSATTRYAEMLVDVVSLPVSRTPALISLGVAENRKTLERRIRSLKFIGHKKTKLIQLITGIVLFAALIALIPFRLVAAEPENPKLDTALDDLQRMKAAELRGLERQQIREKLVAERLKALSKSPEYAALQSDQNDDPVEIEKVRSFDRVEPDPNLKPATSLQPGEAARILAEIRDKDRAELRRILPTLTGDTLLTKYLNDLSEAEQKYADVQNDFADEHPEIIRVRSVLKQINRQIENRIDGILAGLEAKASVDEKLKHDLAETARSSDAVSVPREVVRVAPAGPLSVHARVGGMVEKVLVSLGEDVKKGQPLLEMDNSAARSRLNTAEARAKIAEADLRIARAELDDSQREYERKKQLVADRLAASDTLPNLEKVKAAIIKAEAQAELAFLERDQARQDLDKCVLRTPRDGTISFIIHEGYFVPEGGGKILAEIRTKESDRAAYTQAVERLRQELTDLRAKETELLQKYTPRHSSVLNVQRRIATLENRLRQEEIDSKAEQ